MKKGIRIAILGVAFAIIMMAILPYIFVSSPFIDQTTVQIPAKIDDTFRILEDLRTWPQWAWPWSENPDSEVIWYDNSRGQYAGFYWESLNKTSSKGVLEVRSLEAPTSLTCAIIQEQKPDTEITFTLQVQTDTTTYIMMQTTLPVGSTPWERLGFLLKKGKFKKHKRVELERFKAIFTQ